MFRAVEPNETRAGEWGPKCGRSRHNSRYTMSVAVTFGIFFSFFLDSERNDEEFIGFALRPYRGMRRPEWR